MLGGLFDGVCIHYVIYVRYTNVLIQEIDFMTMAVYYPLSGDEKEEIEASAILSEDTMTMISVYTVTRNQIPIDLLGMYAGIPVQIWIAILLSYFTFMSVLHMALKRYQDTVLKDAISKNIKRKTDAAWITTSAFLDQDNFPDTTMKVSGISLLVSIVMFFLMEYATNCIGSDLVIVDKPFAISGYQDMLDKIDMGYEIVAGFSPMFAESEKFREAPKDSMERNVFDHSIMVPLDTPSVSEANVRMLNQQQVMIGRETSVQGVAYSMLMLFGRDKPDIRILSIQEKEPKKFTNVVAWNKNISVLFQRQAHKL